MAVVGEAQIIVRAIGTSVKADIKNIFDGLDSVGGTSGKNLGEKFSQGFNKSGANNAVGKLADGLKKMYPEAERARETWQKLTKTGFVLGPMISGLVASISTLIGSLVSIVGAAGAAGSSLIVLGNVLSAMGLAMLSAKIALGGVLEALGKLGKGGGGAAKATDAIRRAQERLALVIEQNNEAIINANNRITDAQLNLNDALEAGREELQQLGFAAEEAALAQQGAALDLERAREELARVQDLPPNSRIRREAELAFAQAELQYRQALDANADIAAEQERYVESGVEGTEQVINARRELAEAEADLARTVRDGLRAQLEAERALEEARKNRSGGADPFEGLTKSQRIFVKEMHKLKPLFEAVQEQVAAAFLPLLGIAIKGFANDVLPSIGDGLAVIGAELGKAAVRFAGFLASAEGMELINTFFENSAKLIKPMADAFGLLMQIFIRLVNAAAPVAERFVNWIVEGFENFNNYLKDLDKDGSLTEFFQTAGDAAAEFGAYFGEVFRLIGQIIGANLGEGSPGREMVVWLTEGLRAANDLRDAAGGSGLREYFAAVNENVKPMLEFLGQMGRILIDMGANPAVGEMFETLKQAEPSIRKIAMALLGAAPALAELTVEILRIVAAFVDTEQIEAFLGTLTSIASVVADVVEQAWFQKLLSQIGPLLGTFLALQTALNTAKFAFNVIIGSLIGLLSIVGSVIGAVATFKKLWKLIAASNPVGWIILIVAAFVDFVAGSEQMQNYIGTIIQYFQQWGRAAGQVMNFLKPLIQVIDLLFTIIGGLAAIVFQIGTAFVMVFGKMILRAWNQFYGTFEPALTQIIGGLEVAIEAVKWFFDMLIGGISTAIGWVEVFFGVADANDAVATSADSAATNLGTTADAIDNTGTAASNNTGAVNGFADGVNAIKSSAVDAITSNLDFMDSMDSLSSSIEGNKSKLLDNTAAGRENQRAILDAAQAVQDKMQADIDAGLPLDEVNARYKENYEALKQTAIEAGLAESEVEAFVKAILKAPALTELELRLNTDNAQRRLNDFIRNNGGTPAFIGGAGATLRAFGGFDDHVKGVSFASGGISEGVYRSMARPLIKFAEPETGWEAFVSGRKGSEERNRGIVREAASRLGMNMGGVSITVNPSPGMDERALAGAVSQEITKLMRKGSIY
jgi:hypothetical protein